MELNLEYKQNAPQKQFHNSNAKYRAFIGGIRSGKTWAGAWETFRLLLNYPGIKFLLVAPTYSIVTESSLDTFLSICPSELIFKKNEDKKWLRLFNGSKLLWRSAEEPNTILSGLGVGGLWFDEAAKCPTDEAWKIAIGRLSQQNMPCCAYCTTTPKGLNWLYDFFVKELKPDTEVIYSATLENKANLPPGYLEALEQQYSGAFYRQELLAQFVSFEGLVYPNFNLALHISERDTRSLRHIGGIDFGYTNPTVFLAIAIDHDDRLHICDEIYQSYRTLDELKPEILAQKKQYNIEAYYADPSEPGLVKTLRGWGLTVREADNDILPGIIEVTERLNLKPDGRTRLTVSERCANTIQEFSQYRYADPKPNRNPDEKPIKLSDHAMDALRYAAMSLRKSGDSSRFSLVRLRRNW